MANKMQWFIDDYRKGVLHKTIAKTAGKTIADTNKDFGTVCMPTGTGKSGVMFQDVIYRIDNFRGGKLVINISSPILKLAQQLVNDLFEAMSGIYGDLRFVQFFFNSSDLASNYPVDELGINVTRFETDFDRFMAGGRAKVAVVASCHKSLYKFVNKISKYKGQAEFDTYIDECHMIDIDPGEDDEDMTYVDVAKLRKYSSHVYMFSATPDRAVTCALDPSLNSNIVTKKSDYYIINKRPKEAIRANEILPPLIRFMYSGDGHTSVKMLLDIMKDAKETNPDINHKVLVTTHSSDELLSIRKGLESRGFKVFSTCSKYGYGTKRNYDKYDPDGYDDIATFIGEVDSFDGDCFVLHIRQLIQGIDIKSLTDCVICTSEMNGKERYRHTIQTVGRVLRPASGERGKPMERRTKKVGKAYFVIPEENDRVEERVRDFMMRYYGLDEVLFEENRFRCRSAYPVNESYVSQGRNNVVKGKSLCCIQELKDRIDAYVRSNSGRLRDVDRSIFGRSDPEIARSVLEKCDYIARKNITLSEELLMDDTFLMEMALESVRRYV